jgi:HlyD family secretion protein
MSSFLMRAGILVCAVGLVVGSTTSAQDRKAEEPDAAKGVNVFNPVEGRATIILSKPEGAAVKKGEVVCELDSLPLRDRLTNQVIIIAGAEADFENAKLTREVAEMAVTEYTEGVYKQDRQTIEGELALAQSDRQRAEDRVVWAKRMFNKGLVAQGALTSDELRLKKSIFTEEQAQTKKEVLQNYLSRKTVKQLQSEVEKAKAAELAKKAVFEREQTVRKSLLKQIGACVVRAPADGRVSYTRLFGEGAVVRDGDLLFRVVPNDVPRP